MSAARRPSQPKLGLARPEKICAHHFRGEVSAEQSRADVSQREAFLESKMGLLNYLARELQKVTHHNEFRVVWGVVVGGDQWLAQISAP